MARAKARPLRYAELRRRLKRFGVSELPYRGKGSERLFVRRDPVTGQGPKYSVACHGEHTPIGVGAILTCLRRFAITPDQFWAGDD
jgi:hypothetical protein